MYEKFIANYMKKCVDSGKTSPEDICEEAKKEIEELDEKLEELNVLRTRQGHLRMVIRSLGGEKFWLEK